MQSQHFKCTTSKSKFKVKGTPIFLFIVFKSLKLGEEHNLPFRATAILFIIIIFYRFDLLGTHPLLTVLFTLLSLKYPKQTNHLPIPFIQFNPYFSLVNTACGIHIPPHRNTSLPTNEYILHTACCLRHIIISV